jgi:hypothetical protein
LNFVGMSPSIRPKSHQVSSSKDAAGGSEVNDDAALENALKLGICSKTRFPSSQGVPQDAAALLNVACTGAKNIVQRGSTRKGRVLCVFADRVKPVKGGKLGTIHNLDGDPYMDVAFPEGVMRFRGSLIFPQNKYLALKVGNREVVCEDVFDSLLLFGEVDWLPEGDPARKRKIRRSTEDLPESLRARKLHAAGDEKKGRRSADLKDGKEDDEGEDEEKHEKTARPARERAQRTQPARNIVVLDDTDDDTE